MSPLFPPSSAGRTIFLINPLLRIKHYATNIRFARFSGKKVGITPLALPLLAALTPERFAVRIIDEEVEKLPGGPPPDLVGITAMTTNVDRAYEIADWFRGRGVTVIMGGPHVSVCTEEALRHADCVVKGEAEHLWAGLLDDFDNGRLRPIYQSATPAAFTRSPRPRWDLVDTGNVAALSVQVSRGCPFHCEFCLVSGLFGDTMRYREIDDVVEEVRSLPGKTIFFVDDNLTADKHYAHQLMQRLAPLGIQWFCMSSIEISRFPDLLAAMAASGCMHILIGFESLNPDSLAEVDKKQNRATDYAEAVRRIHAAGITVNASLIVGFDHDTLEEYRRIHDFVHAAGLWYVNLNILDAIPGTRLHERIKAQGRCVDRPPWFSGGMFPVIHYAGVSQVALFDANLAAIRRLYSFEDMRERVVRLFSSGAFAAEYNNPDVTAAAKVVMTLRLLWIYVVAAGRHKRRFFIDLIRLIAHKKVAIEKVVFLLITVEGINRHLRALRPRLPAWREEIGRLDQGPWKEMRPGP